jgi:hypothetical protein
VEHKEVCIHENFRNYGGHEMVAVKFVHHSSNCNLGDLSNQGCMFASMGYDWAFGNCLKLGLVGYHSLKKGKVGHHLLSVHWFHKFDIQFLEQILIDHSFSIVVPRLF